MKVVKKHEIIKLLSLRLIINKKVITVKVMVYILKSLNYTINKNLIIISQLQNMTQGICYKILATQSTNQTNFLSYKI